MNELLDTKAIQRVKMRWNYEWLFFAGMMVFSMFTVARISYRLFDGTRDADLWTIILLIGNSLASPFWAFVLADKKPKIPCES